MGTQWYTGSMSTLLWVTCWIARRMCGSRTTGSWFHLGTPLVTLVIGTHDTLRCGGRLRGGAQRYRSPPIDIPGQWTCQACGQERVWPVKTSCFRCGVQIVMCLYSLNLFWLVPWVVSPKGQVPRTRLTGPSVRIRSLFTRMARRKIFLAASGICSRVPSGQP